MNGNSSSTRCPSKRERRDPAAASNSSNDRRSPGRSGGARCRRASGTAPAAARLGTTAVPPAGSAATISAFALATFSTVPSSSRWTGPMLVITPTSGRATSHSSAIWPSPRMPISRRRPPCRARSGERQRQTDLVVVPALRRDRARVRAAQRRQDVLRRRLPGGAGDPDDAGRLRERTAPAEGRERREGVVGLERRRGSARERVRTKSEPVPTATKRSPSSISRESIRRPVASSVQGARSSRRGELLDLVERERDHAVAPRSLAGPRGRLRGRRRELFGRRTPDPARGPCRRSRRRRRALRPRPRARSRHGGPARPRGRRPCPRRPPR